MASCPSVTASSSSGAASAGVVAVVQVVSSSQANQGPRPGFFIGNLGLRQPPVIQCSVPLRQWWTGGGVWYNYRLGEHRWDGADCPVT